MNEKEVVSEGAEVRRRLETSLLCLLLNLHLMFSTNCDNRLHRPVLKESTLARSTVKNSIKSKTN